MRNSSVIALPPPPTTFVMGSPRAGQSDPTARVRKGSFVHPSELPGYSFNNRPSSNNYDSQYQRRGNRPAGLYDRPESTDRRPRSYSEQPDANRPTGHPRQSEPPNRHTTQSRPHNNSLGLMSYPGSNSNQAPTFNEGQRDPQTRGLPRANVDSYPEPVASYRQPSLDPVEKSQKSADRQRDIKSPRSSTEERDRAKRKQSKENRIDSPIQKNTEQQTFTRPGRKESDQHSFHNDDVEKYNDKSGLARGTLDNSKHQPRQSRQSVGSGDDGSLPRKDSRVKDPAERKSDKTNRNSAERSRNSSRRGSEGGPIENLSDAPSSGKSSIKDGTSSPTDYTEQEQMSPFTDDDDTDDENGENDEDNALIENNNSAEASEEEQDENETDSEKEDNGTETKKCKFLKKLKNPFTEKLCEALEKVKHKFHVDVIAAMKKHSEDGQDEPMFLTMNFENHPEDESRCKRSLRKLKNLLGGYYCRKCEGNKENNVYGEIKEKQPDLEGNHIVFECQRGRRCMVDYDNQYIRDCALYVAPCCCEPELVERGVHVGTKFLDETYGCTGQVFVSYSFENRTPRCEKFLATLNEKQREFILGICEGKDTLKSGIYSKALHNTKEVLENTEAENGDINGSNNSEYEPEKESTA